MDQIVRVDKLVHGGQGLGQLEDGRKVFLWNTLPGELVAFEARKSKKNYLEGVATQVIEPATERIAPKDEAYLSTSPWQIMTFEAENQHKKEILEETFQREHVSYSQEIAFYAGERQWRYRSKMEYSFWGDETGLHLALFHRASHGKRIVQGSSIAMPAIDETANKVLSILRSHDIRASQLKTIIVRCDQEGNAVAALFVKDRQFLEIPELAGVCRGMVVYFSNPKSPASVITKEMYRYGDLTLADKIMGKVIKYDVNSFFQVNLEVFEQAVNRIGYLTVGADACIDMYAGVGSIGLSIGRHSTLIESDHHNCEMARNNVGQTGAEVVETPAEKALEYIDSTHTLIVDPPRAGLHKDVIERIREVLPPQIIYLSCNPITQARDIALLQDMYSLQSLQGYNFFPRTPHIESLAALKRL